MSLLNTELGLAPLHPPGVRWPPSLPWQCPGEFCPERGLGREDGRLRETACEAAGSLFLALLPLPQSVLPCLFYFLHIHYSYSMSQDSAFGKTWYIHTTDTTQSQKRMKSCHLQQHGCNQRLLLTGVTQRKTNVSVICGPENATQMNLSTKQTQTQKTDLWLPREKGWWRNESGDWDAQMQAVTYSMDEHQAPTAQHREVWSISWDKP